jgi:hypothetical protein
MLPLALYCRCVTFVLQRTGTSSALPGLHAPTTNQSRSSMVLHNFSWQVICAATSKHRSSWHPCCTYMHTQLPLGERFGRSVEHAPPPSGMWHFFWYCWFPEGPERRPLAVCLPLPHAHCQLCASSSKIDTLDTLRQSPPCNSRSRLQRQCESINGHGAKQTALWALWAFTTRHQPHVRHRSSS